LGTPGQRPPDEEPGQPGTGRIEFKNKLVASYVCGYPQTKKALEKPALRLDFFKKK
jgi:hypothetical protein